MAGLLTGPGPGLLEESVIAGVTGNLFNGIDSEPFRTTQLRAQFRIPTGFPIELAGKDSRSQHHPLVQRYGKFL